LKISCHRPKKTKADGILTTQDRFSSLIVAGSMREIFSVFPFMDERNFTRGVESKLYLPVCLS